MSKRIRKKEKVRGLPLTNSPATPPGPWVVVEWSARDAAEAPRRRKGPKPGTVDRYGHSDRTLYEDMRRLMSEGYISATAAARYLAENGKIEGSGTSESLARRLARDIARRSNNGHGFTLRGNLLLLATL
jgi:hypothetical protein